MFWLTSYIPDYLSAFYSHEIFLWNSSTTYFFCSIRIWKIYSLLNCNKYSLLTKYCNNKKIFIYLIIINGMNWKLIHQFLVCCSQMGQARLWDPKIVLSLWSWFFLSIFLYIIYRKLFYLGALAKIQQTYIPVTKI